eukprot:1161871-Pelagomonas_calceolata.AAC.11
MHLGVRPPGVGDEMAELAQTPGRTMMKVAQDFLEPCRHAAEGALSMKAHAKKRGRIFLPLPSIQESCLHHIFTALS